MSRFALVTCFLLSLPSIALAQIIWTEPFSYPNGTSTGANNNTANPANDWTSSCATCVAGDWFSVMANLMEGLDTNGPASLETEVIDISAYPSGVEFSLDLSEAGTLEGCPSGVSSGCNSIDWIRVEYSLNGGGYVDCTHVTGGACSGACAGNTYVTIDDFTTLTFTQCPLTGNSLRIRVTVQCWAADEFLRIDNLTVRGSTCGPLAVGDIALDAQRQGDHVQLHWTVSEDLDATVFAVERGIPSTDFVSVALMEPEEATDYHFADVVSQEATMLYRVRAMHPDGSVSYSNVERVAGEGHGKVALTTFPNPAGDRLMLDAAGVPIVEVQIFDLTGQGLLVLKGDNLTFVDLITLPTGIYLLEAITPEGTLLAKFAHH